MFQIQMGYPTMLPLSRTSFARVSDVFSHLFAGEEQAFYILWKDIPIRFRYCQDLADNIDAILAMTWQLHCQAKGSAHITLRNPLLSMSLSVEWFDYMVTLNAKFDSAVSLYHEYVNKLNSTGELNISSQSFLAEWHTLIHQVALFLYKADIFIEKNDSQSSLHYLNTLDQQLTGYGSLYKAIS